MVEEEVKHIEDSLIQLIESGITGYQVAKHTGISESQMSRLRSGKIELDNLRWITIKKLMEFTKKEV